MKEHISAQPGSFECRLAAILPKLRSKTFLNSTGLAGEIRFYIFDYPPAQELVMRAHINDIESDLNSSEFVYTSFNLFKQICDLLESRGLLEKAFKLQEEQGDEALLKAIKGPLAPHRVATFLVNNLMPNSQFLLIHGIGSAWPMIKGPGLLNALQSKVGGMPVVMFYPGEFKNGKLKLFSDDNIESDDYYRAFRLVD